MHDPRHGAPPAALFSVLRSLDAAVPTASAVLARRLHLPLPEVEAALQAIAGHGVALAREAGGLRLGRPFDALAVEAVAAAMAPAARRAFDLHVVDAIGSTNTDLHERGDALPSGHVLAAELQYAGRGRRGRAWTAPIGGSLAFSLLWKFAGGAGALSGLSLAVGLAVARALERCGASGVMLKWPNDLLVRRGAGLAKLAGILIEIAAAPGAPARAVIGIGINVHLGGAHTRIDQSATDLADLGVTLPRNEVLAALLEELLVTLRAFERDGFAPMAPDWNARHAYHGQQVVINDSGAAPWQARAIGVDADGALLLEGADGPVRVVSGEVSVRRLS